MRGTITERFWAKVALPNERGCLLWTAATDKDGYGRFLVRKGETRRAHRIAYVLTVGAIPDGLVLDHLCRQPGCVRPDHLEPVTNRENIRRGDAPARSGERAAARHAAVTQCPQGHPYSAENTYAYAAKDGTRRRHCRTCARNVNRLYQRARRALLRGGAA